MLSSARKLLTRKLLISNSMHLKIRSRNQSYFSNASENCHESPERLEAMNRNAVDRSYRDCHLSPSAPTTNGSIHDSICIFMSIYCHLFRVTYITLKSTTTFRYLRIILSRTRIKLTSDRSHARLDCLN